MKPLIMRIPSQCQLIHMTDTTRLIPQRAIAIVDNTSKAGVNTTEL